ncbi:NB-ARC [Dillenia turbinata]|uniref:NB-ARC n=1 Tax=Dillenia turbinata TaxID=194707 RepID=A0AAN8ZDB8_9MAGN
MEEILQALKKDDVKVLGLYGMGGVGKTTLIQEVAKRAEAMKLFDEILMAVVSQDLNIRKIQDQFASKLELSLGDDKESDTVRAGRLHEKLEKTGKVLVILDDLWEHLNVQAVGIPSPDKHKCCKIVITTREKDVCDQMDCKNNTFSIMVLSENEGWNLFKKMAGDCVTSAEVEPVATEVAKECRGLPLAIVVVARALKDKILQEDSDIPIESPMRYGIGLGLFHQAGPSGTIQEAREKANSFVDILKSACLLLDGDEEGTVSVHDVVRDFCISSIASKGQPHEFLVKSSWELTKWPEIDCSTDYTAISIFGNNSQQFPHGLDCPKLKILLFSGKHQEVNIVDSFSGTMKELKVLDISCVYIPSFPPSQGLLGKLRTLCLECSPLFPPSLGLLSKLRTLCLEGCRLGEIEMIGDLKGLEILRLRASSFKDNKLPMGISLLTHLRLLDLSSYCRQLLIPCGILLNLSRLEELYLDNCFDEWEEESEEEFYIEYSGRRERYASLSELKSSSHSLTTLMGMHVKDVRLFPKDLFFPKLTTFQIQIGDYLSYDKNYSLSKAGLNVDFEGTSIAKDCGICSLMKRCNCLELSQMGNMIIYGDGFPNLKSLMVRESNNIEEIFISEEGEAVFPELNHLKLYGLPKLASFCNVRQSKKPIQSQSLFTDKIFP